jgi:2-C-methyl-D-erythritol 4-phosphate cytidylyltransferase
LAERTVAAVVVAAGGGTRFGGAAPKQFVELAGRPVAHWAVQAFVEHPAVTTVIVVLPAEAATRVPDWLVESGATVVPGGEERGDSVRAGLDACGGAEVVLVHDGARPLLTADLISRVLARVEPGTGVVPALAVTDTIKEVDGGGAVARTLPRERLRRVQTPQGFVTEELRRAYARTATTGYHGTDDAAVFSEAGGRVVTVAGDEDNLKITVASDLVVADALVGRSTGWGPPA